MNKFQRPARIIQTLRLLGLKSALNYAVYQVGVKSGYYRLKSPILPANENIATPFVSTADIPFPLPDREMLNRVAEPGFDQLRAQAETILRGQFFPFGGELQLLLLVPPGSPVHWSQIKDLDIGRADIKDLWEPARFGWAFTLARAYFHFKDDRYADKFQELLDLFLANNPPNQGPNWASAQEVSLRLIALIFCGKVFSDAPSSASSSRQKQLVTTLLHHTRRVPLTLCYAVAQNNNHLLSEAAALYTAGVFFQSMPESRKWRRSGWKWFNSALLDQIQPDGTYCQHSTNYHRLMLHLALWVHMVARQESCDFSPAVQNRLAAAVKWLSALSDPISGHVSNLGHNDGSNILPLACATSEDYRPVLQAASRAFLGRDLYPPGPWDELSLWLGLENPDSKAAKPVILRSEGIHRIDSGETWGTIRSVQFKSRPAHADQLHVDLWWQGENIARDAGTFRYTAPDPWLNTLSGTAVHNTLVIDEADQMERAGRFMWLNWTEALPVTKDESSNFLTGRRISACLLDYRRSGLQHTRTLTALSPDQWLVSDRVDLVHGEPEEHTFRLHWLLPDWKFDLMENVLEIANENRAVTISVQSNPMNPEFTLAREGKILVGGGQFFPLLGWFSPIYGLKLPCLSFSATLRAKPPIEMVSSWKFSPSLFESGKI